MGTTRFTVAVVVRAHRILMLVVVATVLVVVLVGVISMVNLTFETMRTILR